MTHPLDEFLAERSNTAEKRCIVCGEDVQALVVLTIQKASEDGQQRFGRNSSRSKRFAMCAKHAIAMFERTTAEDLTLTEIVRQVDAEDMP